MFLLRRPWVHHGHHRTATRPAFPVRQGQGGGRVRVPEPRAHLPGRDRSRRNGATRRRYAGPMSGGPALRKTAAGTGTDPKTAFAWRHGSPRAFRGMPEGEPTGLPGAGCRCPTAWRRNIPAIAWGFSDTAVRTGVLSCGRGPGGPARTPVRAGVGGRGGFRPVPPPDRLFPTISPPSGASAGPAERRGERYRTAERCNRGTEPKRNMVKIPRKPGVLNLTLADAAEYGAEEPFDLEGARRGRLRGPLCLTSLKKTGYLDPGELREDASRRATMITALALGERERVSPVDRVFIGGVPPLAETLVEYLNRAGLPSYYAFLQQVNGGGGYRQIISLDSVCQKTPCFSGDRAESGGFRLHGTAGGGNI